MAKIAVELKHALARRREDGTPGRTTPRVIGRGDGWTVADVVCISGPHDHVVQFEDLCSTLLEEAPSEEGVGAYEF